MMARPAARAGMLAFWLLAIWAVWAGALLWPGETRIDLHEGDTLHFAAIVLRMAEGELPHLDFMTPLGVASSAPIAAFVAAGAGLGAAIMQAQVALGLVLVPLMWWIGVSRLGAGWVALGLGALVLTLSMALVYGGSDGSISISMHYNRWGWGLAFAVLALALLPPDRPRPWFEGVLVGGLMALLALLKMTYFVAFLPAVTAALLIRGERRTVVVALGTGLAAIVAVSLVAGLGFLPAYIGDLLTVARSETRSAPGLTISGVVTAPAYIGGSLLAVLSVILLRRAGQAEAGLVLLLAVPGFFLVTWQNFGNDPQWLPFLALMLLALRPAEEEEGGRALLLAAVAAGALGLTSLVNTTVSPFRHIAREQIGYVPLLPALPQHGDLLLAEARGSDVLARRPIVGDPTLGGPELNGERLPNCALRAGVTGWFSGLVEGLRAAEAAAGHPEIRPVMLADLQQVIWLFGAGAPLPGGAPWYYDGLPGGAAAEVMVVPLCPINRDARAHILGEAEAAGWALREIGRDDLAVYLEIGKPGAAGTDAEGDAVSGAGAPAQDP